MDIANPIYDVVFKYLMKDKRVAKMLISKITGLTIDKLEFRTTESTTFLEKQSLTVYRLDFAASIVTKEGTLKKILIEIQKAKYSHDIMRFRRYLGNEYRSKDNRIEKKTNGGVSITAIPILTIYFLGYALEHTKAPVVKVNRQYIDAVTGKEIEEREDFIESLTHDSYVIQIPYITHKRKNDLLAILSIFDQKAKTTEGDGHILRINENDFPKEYRGIIRRLQKAVAEPEVRETMDLEDEIIEDLQNKERMVLIAEEKAEKERTEKEKAQENAEKECAEKEKAQKNAEKERTEKEKERAEKEKAQKEAEKERIEKEKAQEKTEKERVEKEKALEELERLRKQIGK